MSVTVSHPRAITRVRHPLRSRLLTVVSVEKLAARMVRIRLAGDDLADFVSSSPQDHVKLFLPDEPGATPELPEVVDDRWVGGRHLTSRDYTVRRVDAEAGTLDIDLLVHEHGAAGRWAGKAAVGDRVGVLGPRGSVMIPDDFAWYVFAVDETALPAAARWLESLRSDARVTVVVEAQDDGNVIDLPTAARAEITWLFRGRAEPGTSSLLADAVQTLDLPEGDGFVWVAGEAESIKPVRRYLRRMGFGRDQHDVDGYWRRGVSDFDHHEAAG
ncbi:siderophore-interacting protein [Sanguibacter sp. A247]|uniref:siderophore-interacting protein n=1 Tax=unclassified Sanguibacter TaxID=2645534 RepID=UPI003FD6EBFC